MHVLSPLFRITVLTLLLLCTPTKLKANDGKETIGHKEEPREAIGPAEHSFRQGLRCDNELHQPMDAVRCYSMAEKLGHAAAAGKLGQHFAKGDGCDCDKVKAMRLFVKALKGGDTTALKPATKMLIDAYNDPTDTTEFSETDMAVVYGTAATLAMMMDDAAAMYCYGLQLIYVFTDVECHIEEGLNLMQKSAKLGDADAMYFLACWFLNHKENDKAMSYMKAAAEAGLPDANAHLGYITLKGLYGVVQNREKALKLLQYAAENGNTTLRYMVGLYMYQAEDDKNCAICLMGEKWIKQAANQLHPNAKKWVLQHKK